MKNLILLLSCVVFAGSIASAGPVKKYRDKIRLLGYQTVVSQEVYLMNESTGELEHVQTDVSCSGPGRTRCRVGGIVYSGNELDDFDEYTSSEKLEAQEVIDDGDDEILAGVSSGTEDNTVQFVNTETGESYYRTFTYSWFTNTNESIESNLEISDPF